MGTYLNSMVRTVVALVVARLLEPADYGLMGMAVTVTGFLEAFRGFGFTSAVIQRKEVNDRVLNGVFWIGTLFSFTLAATLALGAPWIGKFYHDARVADIILVLSLNFVILPFGMVPTALLNRRMEFARLGFQDFSQSLLAGASALALAASGWGVWALVGGSLVNAITGAIVVNALCPWRPGLRFSWQDVRDTVGFGGNVAGFQIFNYWARKGDDLIIGRFLGPQQLGYYSLGYRLMLMPLELVTTVLARVLYPALSRLRDDEKRFGSAYMRLVGSIAFVTFPMMAGLSVLAQPLVEALLGEKWLPAVPIVMVLAPLGMLQSVASSTEVVMLGKGRSDIFVNWGVFAGLIILASFFAGLPWGALGVAVSYALAFTLLFFPLIMITGRLMPGFSSVEFFRLLFRHGCAAGVMAAVTYIVRWQVEEDGGGPFLVLAAGIPAGVACYCALVLLTKSRELEDMVRLLPEQWMKRARLLGRPAPDNAP